MIDQLKSIYIDGELDVVDTARARICRDGPLSDSCAAKTVSLGKAKKIDL
jgi:hypothetical protein